MSKLMDSRLKLLLIIILAFCLRLYRINYPLLDWHSWRQTDTASVTREYIKHGVDLLHPTYQDLSNIPSGKDNSQIGYRMVEFPIVNAVIAQVIRVFPDLPLVATSRVFSILASLGTIIVLYFLTKNLWSENIALLTAISYAVLPYIVYYSRTILPEPYMVFFSTLSIASFYFWLKRERLAWLTTSILSLAIAILLKPFALFLGLVFVAILIEEKGLFFWKKMGLSQILGLLVFLPVALLPFKLWRDWITNYPEGIPASDWLFNSNEIRLRPAWFRWLGYERFTKLIWGYLGVVFAPFAVAKLLKQKQKKSHFLIFLSWWLGIGAYLVVIATGNVHHDYYQSMASPIIAITTGLGISFMFHTLKNRVGGQSALFVSTIFCSLVWFLAWKQVSGYFNVNHWEYVVAGKAVDRLVPESAKVIAPAFGDTAFLFQTNRTGWPIGFEIDPKIKAGATHYVTTAFDDEAVKLMELYTIVEKNSSYVLIDLTKPIQPTKPVEPTNPTQPKKL
jgi:hypothetical protein